VRFFYDLIEKYVLGDYKAALKLINKHLNLDKSQKIVDIGGGTGVIANSIFEKVSSVTVLDYSKQMLKKMKNPMINTVQVNSSYIPVKDGVYDVALLINVLHHIDKSEQTSTLLESYRILKNNGEIFILDLFFPPTFSNRVFNKFEEIAVGKTYHISHKQVLSILEKIGFKDVSFTFPDRRKWKYLIVAKK